MDHVTGLRCVICASVYQPDEVEYVCPQHGDDGILDVEYDYGLIGRRLTPRALAASNDLSIWRYRALLPVRPESPAPPLAVGWTPLYRAPRLGEPLGLRHVWLKDDGRQPTASFKDRASALAVVKARERKAEVVATASTGNAAAALAGLCASVGQPCVIFAPQSAPPAKIAQFLAYGATVLLVDGAYDDAFELCLQASRRYGWYNRNTAFNPYMSEGKKTVSYEICEQLTSLPSSLGRGVGDEGWQAPDAVFVGVGDGCIIGGIHKGFKDLVALGWIDRLPRLYGVQAAGSNYLAQAWQRGEDVLTKPPIIAHTIADSISAGLPRDRIKALAAVEQTGGAFITVSDEEILAAIPALAHASGVFAEPAGAASYAGLVKAAAEGLARADDRIVVVNTGSGLKDVKSAMAAVEQSGARLHRVEPRLADVERALGA
jgi:threonine synthase